jgi:hypothetical protein
MTTQQDAANMPPQAVIYLRFATVDRTGNKVAAARQACEQRAHELGAIIKAEYTDVGSGLTDEREQLQQLLADLTDASITYVIVPEHLTIARSMHVYARIVWKIEQAGARLMVASTPLEGYGPIKPNPLGLEQAVADWANNETRDAPAARHIRRHTAPPDPAGQEGGESPGTSTDREAHHD